MPRQPVNNSNISNNSNSNNESISNLINEATNNIENNQERRDARIILRENPERLSGYQRLMNKQQYKINSKSRRQNRQKRRNNRATRQKARILALSHRMDLPMNVIREIAKYSVHKTK